MTGLNPKLLGRWYVCQKEDWESSILRYRIKLC